MGQCCCKVKVIDRQLYENLLAAVDALRGSGTCAVVSDHGELITLRNDGATGNQGHLLLSLLPDLLRASIALAIAMGSDSAQASSIVINGSTWSCQVTRLPRSLASVVLFNERLGLDNGSVVVAPQQIQLLEAIDECYLVLKQDIALATAALQATHA